VCSSLCVREPVSHPYQTQQRSVCFNLCIFG
jgi:hypothetical protein